MEFDVIIAAAGSSTRMGVNKMALTIANETTLERTLEAFLGLEGIRRIIIATRLDNVKESESLAKKYKSYDIVVSEGGKNREETVYKALKHVSSKGVMIHDGARPFVSSVLIRKIMESVAVMGSCIPVIKLSDSIRRVENKKITGTLNRDKYCSVQTPQAFLTQDIVSAFEAIILSGKDLSSYSDESEIYLEFFKEPFTVPGERKNTKLTEPGDIFGLNARVGSGYDIHLLVPGRKLVICGIEIQNDLGCFAHSDGDVGIHALIDALLSAIGELDIGSHFPDSDIKYSGIDSSFMLSEVMEKVKEKNHYINNVSIVIMLEKPKIAEYIPIMRVKLANIMQMKLTDVSISAKTGEGLGEIGEGKAIAAYATTIVF